MVLYINFTCTWLAWGPNVLKVKNKQLSAVSATLFSWLYHNLSMLYNSLIIPFILQKNGEKKKSSHKEAEILRSVWLLQRVTFEFYPLLQLLDDTHPSRLPCKFMFNARFVTFQDVIFSYFKLQEVLECVHWQTLIPMKQEVNGSGEWLHGCCHAQGFGFYDLSCTFERLGMLMSAGMQLTRWGKSVLGSRLDGLISRTRLYGWRGCTSDWQKSQGTVTLGNSREKT